jgi:hypothetical protein
MHLVALVLMDGLKGYGFESLLRRGCRFVLLHFIQDCSELSHHLCPANNFKILPLFSKGVAIFRISYLFLM